MQNHDSKYLSCVLCLQTGYATAVKMSLFHGRKYDSWTFLTLLTLEQFWHKEWARILSSLEHWFICPSCNLAFNMTCLPEFGQMWWSFKPKYQKLTPWFCLLYTLRLCLLNVIKVKALRSQFYYPSHPCCLVANIVASANNVTNFVKVEDKIE